jgi:hypothetical protein
MRLRGGRNCGNEGCLPKLVWLGGLDSNQDNQIQNLMYCQLYDLPAEGETTKKAANATCTYFNGGNYIRQPGDGGRH